MDQQNEKPVKSSKAARVLRIVIISVVGYLLLLTLGVFIFVMSFRSIGDDIITSGDFEYIVVEENGDNSKRGEEVAALVGLTLSGISKEVIDVPRKIDGKPVRYIGYRKHDGSWISVNYYHWEGWNLKKLYIHDNIKAVCREALSYLESVNELEIMLCSYDCDNNIIFEGVPELKMIYLYRSVYESKKFPNYYAPANIVFMNNYSDEVNGGYYRLDNIETGETIPEPPAPEREGYTFGGWYTEPECVTAWDFGDSPRIEEDAEFRLYAKWRAM